MTICPHCGPDDLETKAGQPADPENNAGELPEGVWCMGCAEFVESMYVPEREDGMKWPRTRVKA